MDPEQALQDAREAVARVRRAQSGEDLQEGAEALANAFEALDDWMSQEGFPPPDWRWGNG